MAKVGTEPISRNARRAAFAVSVIGLGLFAYSAYRVAMAPISLEWVLLGLVTVLMVSRLDIGIPRAASTITLTDTFLFISVILYGTHPSVVLAGLDAAVCSLQYPSRRRVLWLNAAVMSLSVFVAGHATEWLFGDLAALTGDTARLAMAVALLALVHYAVNTLIVGGITALKRNRSLGDTYRDSFLWTSASYFVGAVAALLLIKLITVVSFYAFITAVPILAITYFTYKVYLDKVETSNRHAEQMADLHLRTIEALAIAIDAKDEVTHAHVRRVQIYATGLARLFGLSEAEVEALKAGALLHDIGKLAVPDYILNKPGALTPAEFEKMKIHTIVGAEILERVGFPYPVVPVVRHHHERWDGRGYPDGLRGDQIPITARILTLADCYDTVREHRPYRKAMSREQAIQMLREGSGTVFDPTVVSVFLEHLEEFEQEIRDQGVEHPAFEPRGAFQSGRDVRVDPTPRPFERIRSAQREVIALYNLAQTIGNSLDLRDTFAVFSARLQDIINYTTCVLYLVRPDTTDVEVAHVAGRNAERLKGRKMALGAGIAGWVIANRHSMHNCDPRLDIDALKATVEETYQTATVVPLIRDDETFGALALYSADEKSFDPDHLRVVEAVAKLATDAIANAVRQEKPELSELTDTLTALPNARALRYRFQEEADRARRHRDTFCLLLLDVEGMRAFNERYGAEVGDELLREMAKVLSTLIRSSDFLCRYGRDEFVALVQTTPEEAQELVQRIQLAIDRRGFDAPGTRTFIGASIGWSCFGSDGDSIDEMILKAERAMQADRLRRKAQQSNQPRTGELGQLRVM